MKTNIATAARQLFRSDWGGHAAAELTGFLTMARRNLDSTETRAVAVLVSEFSAGHVDAVMDALAGEHLLDGEFGKERDPHEPREYNDADGVQTMGDFQ